MAGKTEETIAAVQQRNLESAMQLAQLSIENSQRILQMQVEVAREIFEDGVASAKDLAQVKSPQEAMEVRARYAQQTAEKMLSCSRGIAEITTDMQTELGKLVSEHLDKGSKGVLDAWQQMFSGVPLNNQMASQALEQTFEAARKTLEQVSRASRDAFSAMGPAGGSAPTRKR